jgi:hypothetical protein
MIDNLDCGMTIAKDWDRDGQMYMTFHRIKMRDKGSTRDYIAQPFLPGDNQIRLIEDYSGMPQFKESIHGMPSLPLTSGNVKMDGASSLNSIINIDDLSENTFNLKPPTIEVTAENDKFNSEMEEFDNDISEFIIQSNAINESMMQPLITRNPFIEVNGSFVRSPFISIR